MAVPLSPLSAQDIKGFAFTFQEWLRRLALFLNGIESFCQEAVGTILTDSDTIDFTFTPATPEITAEVKVQKSIVSDASGIALDGDSASPGNSYFYSTDASGIRGWYPQATSSGTFTPTLTNVANLGASTAYQCQYLKAGSTVTVSGKVDVDPAVAATSTSLGISLPIASSLGAAEDLAGCAFCPSVAGQGAALLADTTNDRAQMTWVATDITNQPMYFTFTYQVI